MTVTPKILSNYVDTSHWTKGKIDTKEKRLTTTAQKMKFFIKDFFSKCD